LMKTDKPFELQWNIGSRIITPDYSG